MPDTWSPSTYLQFKDERTRAARDLLAQVPLTSARKIVDVGCGPGNSTALLVSRFPNADILGFDTSSSMIEEARKTVPGARFAEADATVWLPEPDVDLVFANATYQWIANQLSLFPRLLASVQGGAVVAIQMPDNVAEPSHRLMEQVANEGPWADRLRNAAREPLPSVAAFYDALAPVTSRLDIWHTIYNHVLDGPDAIVDWVRGTGLRPFVDPLSPDERAGFLRRYRDEIARVYPRTADGKALLRFPRIFIVAVR
jgi:trans-aconitate 2-methyltransferase